MNAEPTIWLSNKDDIKALLKRMGGGGREARAARKQFEAFIAPAISQIIDSLPIHINPDDPFGPRVIRP